MDIYQIAEHYSQHVNQWNNELFVPTVGRKQKLVKFIVENYEPHSKVATKLAERIMSELNGKYDYSREHLPKLGYELSL